MRYKSLALSSLIILMFYSGVPLAEAQSSDKIAQDALSQRLLREAAEHMKQRWQQPFGEDFHVHYKNETATTLNAGPLMEQSTILLDGTQYQYHGPEAKWFSIAAGEDRVFFMSPDNYVPKIKRMVLADSLHRWRWVTGILQGWHSLSFQFGGKQYGPIHFYWNGPGSWNVPYPAASTPQN